MDVLVGRIMDHLGVFGGVWAQVLDPFDVDDPADFWSLCFEVVALTLGGSRFRGHPGFPLRMT